MAEAGKTSAGSTIAAFALSAVLAVGAGVAGASLISPPSIETETNEADKAAPSEEAKDEAAAFIATDLPPILTNLADPADTWVRLEMALVSDAPLDAESVASVGQDILAFLRTVRLSHIEGPGGFITLREALEDRATVGTGGAAKGILIRTMLFE